MCWISRLEIRKLQIKGKRIGNLNLERKKC
jgi:hypothetical protein